MNETTVSRCSQCGQPMRPTDLAERRAEQQKPVAWRGISAIDGCPIFNNPNEPRSNKCGPWIPLYAAPVEPVAQPKHLVRRGLRADGTYPPADDDEPAAQKAISAEEQDELIEVQDYKRRQLIQRNARIATLEGVWTNAQDRCPQCGTGNPQLVAANERLCRLRAAAKHAQCDCSLHERASGHKLGCWFPDFSEALREELNGKHD